MVRASSEVIEIGMSFKSHQPCNAACCQNSLSSVLFERHHHLEELPVSCESKHLNFRSAL